MKTKIAILILGLIGCSATATFADCAGAPEPNRQIKSSTVVSISSCWTGVSTTIAKLANGDKISLGNVEGAGAELTKIRLAQVMQAQANNLPIGYSVAIQPLTICGGQVRNLEWLTVGESNCVGVWN